MAHEPAQHGGFGQNGGIFVRILGKLSRHGLLDGAAICHLFQAPAFDNLFGRTALGPDDLEDVFPPFFRKSCPTYEIHDLAELAGGNRRVFNGFAFLVQAAKSSLITQFAAILPSLPLAVASKKSDEARSALSTLAS